MKRFRDQLDAFKNHADKIVPAIRRGIEKESLRVTDDGRLSQLAHPIALGSPLTHPYITTDYSEALIELVTPEFTTTKDTLNFLAEMHRVVLQNCADQMLWVNSLPCMFEDDTAIPIARYGTSNIGHMKYVYRHGLGLRYGRKMQVIAGIHYNISVPDDYWTRVACVPGKSIQDCASAGYMAGVRNFHRHCWLLFYLFGASPAACRSFLDSKDLQGLHSMGSHTVYAPYATSLRMSNKGYRNPAQSEIIIDHNSVEGYTDSLYRATKTVYPPYEKFGIKKDGQYVQLNTNLLQIENEFYSVIRPKRSIKPLETPTNALRKRGVEYLELRILDLNPYEPIGISDEDAKFLDLFVVFCLLYPSPPNTRDLLEAITANKDTVVMEGRKPNLELIREQTKTTLVSWGNEILDMIDSIAEIFDSVDGVDGYCEAVNVQRGKIADSDKTPSARILNELSTRKEPFFHFAVRTARETKAKILEQSLPMATLEKYEQIATKSLAGQKALEESDEVEFDQFLCEYFSK